MNRNIATIYTSILKHKWRATLRGEFPGVTAIILHSPDETDVKTIWLVNDNYECRDIDTSVTRKICEAFFNEEDLL